jgi:hypothetical protein
VLLLAATAISFCFNRISGEIAFGELNNSAIKKGNLFTHAIIPLAFTFEFVYQLNPLLTRLGDFFPTLGRQFGFDLEFLNFTVSTGTTKIWQVLFILLGIVVSMGFLKILKRNHQADAANGANYKLLRYMPILLLGALYIWLFIIV